MDARPTLSFGGDSATPMDWCLRILPVVFCFFGVAWCAWFLRGTINQRESAQVQPQQSEEPKDPVDLAKSRALMESKLVTRKVLECSSDGTITFSDAITSESAHTQVTCCTADSDSDSESSLEEDDIESCLEEVDNEQQHSPQDGGENDLHSCSSCEADESPSPTRRPSDLKTSTHSLRSSLRRQGSLARMVSALFETNDKDACCGICLMDYDQGDEVCWSPNPECQHAFHKECILDWAVRNPQCPVCRRNYCGNGDDDNV